MPAQYDWGVDVNGDLDVSGDDFSYELSDQNHIVDTVTAYPLWWKQFPADGVGINSYRNSTGQQQQLMGSIKKNLQTDGFNCNNPTVIANTNGTFKIWSNATRA